MSRIIRSVLIVFLFFPGALAFAQEAAAPAAPFLRDLAAEHNLLIGTSLQRGGLNNPGVRKTAPREFDSLTIENELKPASVSGGPGSYFYIAPDYMIAWGEEHGMKIRGHTLVWHNSVPSWLKKANLKKDQVLAFLQDYIATVVGRYKGRIYAWDVLNEVLDEKGRLRDGKTSFWAETCGDGYIEEPFRWARAADPKARLFINDYGVAVVNAKSNGLYALVKKLLARQVPIDGVGFQCHVAEKSPPNFKSVAENVRRFIALGLEVQFTELDVRIQGEPTPEQLKHQAEIYAGFFEIAVLTRGVTGVTLWGAADPVSWIPGAYNGFGSALLFDDEYNPKPAYFAVKEALGRGRLKNK
ncbi:MAG: endo-1,4-beta-xylanase [Spirochaetales bacterium]|nr:endo-1,4-beta-xylanase [Spirochaetales bacterium]